MVLLVPALTVTATKLKRLRAEKGHSDPYYSQTGVGEGKTTERIYDEAGKGTGQIRGKAGHYQELNMETMEERQYEALEETTAKAY